MRRLKKLFKWLAAAAIATATVIMLPELALAFMLIPVLAPINDPYLGAALAVAGSFFGLYILFHVAEIAAVIATVGVVHLIERWQTRVALRHALETA